MNFRANLFDLNKLPTMWIVLETQSTTQSTCLSYREWSPKKKLECGLNTTSLAS